MSVSNLLAPNDYELYIGTLHCDNINPGVTGSTGPDLSIFVNFIDTPSDVPGENGLGIGLHNMGIMALGNTGSSTLHIGEQTMPVSIPGSFGYSYNDSAIEVSSGTVNYSGFFVANNVPCPVCYRKIGNWVDLHIDTVGSANINTGVTGDKTQPLIIANLLPAPYRPSIRADGPCYCINNGTSTVGFGTVETTGTVTFGLAGSNSSGGFAFSFSNATGSAGAGGFNITYCIINA